MKTKDMIPFRCKLPTGDTINANINGVYGRNCTFNNSGGLQLSWHPTESNNAPQRMGIIAIVIEHDGTTTIDSGGYGADFAKAALCALVDASRHAKATPPEERSNVTAVRG